MELVPTTNADHLAASMAEVRERAEPEPPKMAGDFVERTPPTLSSILGSLDERGTYQGYDAEEIRLMKRDVVLSRIASRQPKKVKAMGKRYN